MKRSIFLHIIFLCSFLITSCAQESAKLKIGVFSDPHYLSESLMDKGEAVQKYQLTTGKLIMEVPAILDQVLNDYLNSDIDVLLIPGDMTKDGEEESHKDFIKKLEPLMNKGIKVFVIPGNHDINVPRSLAYKEDKTYPVKNVTPQEFTEIYAACGYNDALMKDTNSLSYVVELNSSTWLLAIDSNRYTEYTDKTISGGKVSQETEQWIVNVLNKAKQKKIEVIGMMHHGLVEHIMMQSVFFAEYLVDDWQRLATLFADMRMKLIFTGHFHANDITEYKSPSGNKIYDVETGSLSVYSFPYRFIELDEKRVKITTKNVTSTKQSLQLALQSRDTMEKKAKQIALQKIKNRGTGFSDNTATLISNIVSKVFIKHLEGDEVVDEALLKDIEHLSKNLELPINPGQLENLDFYPADNNVEINF